MHIPLLYLINIFLLLFILSCASHLKKVHKKGNGERANFITELKENRRCTSLYMQQNTSKIFVEE